MILISNDCSAGYIYKYILKTSYKSPFIWSRVSFEDFYYIVKNFKRINFFDYELKKASPNKLEKFFIHISNKIKLFFNHYKFDKNYNVPTSAGEHIIDVYYNKIWEYIVNKYEVRTKKMYSENKKDICFILHVNSSYIDFKSNKYDNEIKDLITFCEANKIKLLLLIEKPLIKNHKYVKEVLVTNNWFGELMWVDKIKSEIISFLNE